MKKIENLNAEFYQSGIEDEFMHEMCVACRVNGATIPLREVAEAFMAALGKAKLGEDTYAHHWIKAVARPVAGDGWIMPLQSLTLLKLSNMGLDGLKEDTIAEFWKRYNALQARSDSKNITE